MRSPHARSPARAFAFTYVELMIVLTILAILAAIAVPNFLEFHIRASVAKCMADMAALKMAIEAYRTDYRAYPPNRTPAVSDAMDLVVLTTPLAYMTRVPDDVFTTRYGRGATHPREMDRAPLQYLNALQLDSDKGLQIVEGGDAELRGYIAAIIWSIGPDESLPMDPSKPGTAISPEGEARLLRYDPTNGTVSRGDIYTVLP
jgi:prepilin-type N-terminal cleavage/methylation domain-containing protein